MRGFTKMRGKDICNLKGLSDIDYPACAGPVCSCRMGAAVLDSATNETLDSTAPPVGDIPVLFLNASVLIVQMTQTHTCARAHIQTQENK